jgi:hypothetical protein
MAAVKFEREIVNIFLFGYELSRLELNYLSSNKYRLKEFHHHLKIHIYYRIIPKDCTYRFLGY